jgi:hypothetical protein
MFLSYTEAEALPPMDPNTPTPPPLSSPDLEQLIADGARLVQAMRPIFREVREMLPRGAARRYFAFAIGLVGVTVAGAYVLSNLDRPDDADGTGQP